MFEEIHKFHGQAHSQLGYPCFNSCCLAPLSKVRFIDSGAQQFSLKGAESMKGLSVDIIPKLPGDTPPTLSQGRKILPAFHDGRRGDCWGRWKDFHPRVWIAQDVQVTQLYQVDSAPHGFQPSPLFSTISLFLVPISYANSTEKTKLTIFDPFGERVA